MSIRAQIFFENVPRLKLFDTQIYILVYSLFLLPAIAAVLLALYDWLRRPPSPKGCKKLGLRTTSNLSDEHDELYDSGVPPQDINGKNVWRVKSLCIYPVKSCRVVELDEGNVVSSGMEYDRMFSFAEFAPPDDKFPKPHWKFLTQRSHPLLARVEVELWVPDPSSWTYSTRYQDVQSGGVIVLRYPSATRKTVKTFMEKLTARLRGPTTESCFRIPLRPTSEQIKQSKYTMENMRIWKDNPMAINMTCKVPSKLKSFLQVKNDFTLFRASPDHHRKVFRCAPRKDQLGYQSIVGFADAYPLHILNIASVHDVDRAQEGRGPKLSCSRFRANIIMTGPEAYAEDDWKRIRMGEFEYHVVCRTGRCQLPNTNQTTGETHRREPATTLKSFRCIDDGAVGTACLGMMMVPSCEESKIVVGDSIEVLETGAHYYIKQ